MLVTSSSQEKIDRAKELGAEGGVLYTEEGWAEAVGPVDVVLDSVGSTWRESLKALRRGGRLVVYGGTGGPEVTLDVRALYLSWQSIRGSTMGSARDFAATMRMVDTGGWQPVIDSVRPLAEAEAAHDRMKAGEHFGKLVLAIRLTRMARAARRARRAACGSRGRSTPRAFAARDRGGARRVAEREHRGDRLVVAETESRLGRLGILLAVGAAAHTRVPGDEQHVLGAAAGVEAAPPHDRNDQLRSLNVRGREDRVGEPRPGVCVLDEEEPPRLLVAPAPGKAARVEDRPDDVVRDRPIRVLPRLAP